MEISETLKIIFGTTILTALAALLAIAANFFNIRDRFKKWKKERIGRKFKKSFYVNNPDFEFTLSFISNPSPGKCVLRASVLNVSKEIKYIESVMYHFEDPNEPNKYQPPTAFLNGEKWPKRLEHGEKFSVSVDFSSTLYNTAFQYWGRGVQVYCASRSSTGDLLRSNPVDFDTLMGFLDSINNEYLHLAELLAKKTGGSRRDIEISLWQLQIFKRLTVHIAKQLQQNHIPVAQYLVSKHGFIILEDFWFHWYRELEEKKIQPEVVVQFLRNILQQDLIGR